MRSGKIIGILFLILSQSFHAVCQEQHFVQKAKAEFQKEFDDQNYDTAVAYLRKALALNDKNQETHYLMGYALERSVSKDGISIIRHSWKSVKRASDEFLKVISIDSSYRSESVVLDPYSKLTSLWGSLALSYMYQNKRDSALLALKYGKKLGGFSDPLLEFARNTLESCELDSFLFFTGDNYTFSILYVTEVEKYRTDLKTIDVGLLNTNWYVELLTRKKQISLSMPISTFDSLEMTEWKAQEVQIVVKPPPKDIGYIPPSPFRFVLKPTVNNYYLLRSDYILLDIIKKDEFGNNVYFAYGMDPTFQLGLDPYLFNVGLVDLFVPYKSDRYGSHDGSLYTFGKYKFETLSKNKSIIHRSPDLNSLLNLYRYAFLNHIYYQVGIGKKDIARKILAISNTKVPQKVLPFNPGNMKQAYDGLGDQLD